MIWVAARKASASVNTTFVVIFVQLVQHNDEESEMQSYLSRGLLGADGVVQERSTRGHDYVVTTL